MIKGLHNISDESNSRVVIPVQKSFPYPNYTEKSDDGDIALLKLSSDLPLADKRKHLGTICLPKAKESLDALEGKEATVIGWGKTESGK